MRPFFPIIYVRGYAMTQSEIAATVATPYMGFNLGSTKIRQDWQGGVIRHVFESPLVRLMKDYEYRDIYAEGMERTGRLPARSVIVYRYYEQADRDLGRGIVPSIPEAARGLRELIHRLREQICGGDDALLEQFRVYLVAHSMGGLVCRCFLQNDDVSSAADRALVDKVFTYATPHNGIDIAGVNVPRFLDAFDLSNFSRDEMRGYLQLPDGDGRVDSLNGCFDPERFYCLVGTNYRDYDVALGLASRLAGEMSDGLVRIDNARVDGAPCAFVPRSHSGAYGIVNSEEGYQNLTRFLFGDVRARGLVEVENLPLPPSVQRAYEQGSSVRGSYYFEAVVSPRAATLFKLSERRKETFSAVLRGYDGLFHPERAGLDAPRWPVLFSVYLDTRRITVGRTVVFSLELAVSSTGYTVDGHFLFDRHIPGEHLFRDTITLRARPTDDGWQIRYNLTDEVWGERARGPEAERDGQGLFIPLASKKGFRGKLRILIDRWQ